MAKDVQVNKIGITIITMSWVKVKLMKAGRKLKPAAPYNVNLEEIKWNYQSLTLRFLYVIQILNSFDKCAYL